MISGWVLAAFASGYLALLFAVPVLLLWQLVTMITEIPESSLPSPVQVVQALQIHQQLLVGT